MNLIQPVVVELNFLAEFHCRGIHHPCKRAEPPWLALLFSLSPSPTAFSLSPLDPEACRHTMSRRSLKASWEDAA